MSKHHFFHITATLHFDNNEDTDGVQNDSLHKVRPLLEIVKKTLGRYGDPGSELSFDKANIACFSRYGRGRISFNPKKKSQESFTSRSTCPAML